MERFDWNELPTTAEEFLKFATEELKEVSEATGIVLCSAFETLRPGNVLIMGHNPGGKDGQSILEDMALLPTWTKNTYLDEQWDGSEGEHPIQVSLKYACDTLNLDLRAICALNLIFMKSPRAHHVGLKEADICWPINKAVLNLVKPKLLIVFGNAETTHKSPYAYLYDKFKGEYFEADSEHGNYRLKYFDTQLPWGKVRIIGLPHLSWYRNLPKPGPTAWLKEVAAPFLV